MVAYISYVPIHLNISYLNMDGFYVHFSTRDNLTNFNHVDARCLLFEHFLKSFFYPLYVLMSVYVRTFSPPSVVDVVIYY